MSNKMWGGRFAEVPPKFVEEFGAVIKVETRLSRLWQLILAFSI